MQAKSSRPLWVWLTKGRGEPACVRHGRDRRATFSQGAKRSGFGRFASLFWGLRAPSPPV
jgi:hypothetical protein